MNKYTKSFLAAFVLVSALASATSAFALGFGSNITMSDGEMNPYNVWKEDNECEKGMLQNQGWDLEGMFLNGKVLTMIGGFDFFNGKDGVKSGDIFFNTQGGFGGTGGSTPQGNNIVSNTFGYEYALDVDWINKTFKVVDLYGARTKTVYYSENTDTVPGSNPWLYYDRGVVKSTGGTVINGGKISDAASGFSDWGTSGDLNHYVVSFDLSNLFSVAGLNDKEFDIHFTMGCGNDNLMGHASAPVPEPSTFVLLGAGLLGAALYRRRAKK